MITETQKDLLEQINFFKDNTGIFKFNWMKSKCECKSFDTTFNALLFKGHLKHFETTDFSNKFITKIK